jgi:hypothetical protein
MGFYIPEDDILHSHRRENLKPYNCAIHVPSQNGKLNLTQDLVAQSFGLGKWKGFLDSNYDLPQYLSNCYIPINTLIIKELYRVKRMFTTESFAINSKTIPVKAVEAYSVMRY